MTGEVELARVCDIRSGGTPPRSKKEYFGGSIPWAKIGDLESSECVVETEEYISEAGLRAIRGRKFPAGTLLFAIYGSMGKMAFAGTDLSTNQAILAIQPLADNQIDLRYLFHYLNRRVVDLQADGRGVTQKNLSATYLRSLKVPLPPLKEQHWIAAILDKADAILRKHEQALALADDLLKSAFLEMFGDPTTNTKHFPTIVLGDLIKVSSGNGLTAKNMNRTGAYPVYGGNGVTGFHSEYMFDDPQLVIGRVGVYCGAVHLTRPKSWVTDNALYVREYKRPVNMTYLEWVLRFANLNQYASRAAQPLISGSRIYPVEIVFPDESEQNAFEDYVKRQKELLGRLEADRDEAKDLFASLSQRAFCGELQRALCD